MKSFYFLSLFFFIAFTKFLFIAEFVFTWKQDSTLKKKLGKQILIYALNEVTAVIFKGNKNKTQQINNRNM